MNDVTTADTARTATRVAVGTRYRIMPPMTAGPLIDAELAAFLQSGVSMHIATARGNVPQLARAAACRVAPDRRRVTMFVAPAQAVAVLDDVAANGAVAAVFTKPLTHRTVQLKGGDARIVSAGHEEAALVRAQVDAFGAELASMGFPGRLGAILALGGATQLLAITFSVSAAFVQTPGPGAGGALGR